VDDWAAGWAERNGCTVAPTESRLAADVVSSTWSDCDADVQLITVEGGGHGWPGTSDATFGMATTDSIDATDLIWEFFAAHARAGA
jgi:polyhydroxybutyrate depolymerase